MLLLLLLLSSLGQLAGARDHTVDVGVTAAGHAGKGILKCAIKVVTMIAGTETSDLTMLNC